MRVWSDLGGVGTSFGQKVPRRFIWVRRSGRDGARLPNTYGTASGFANAATGKADVGWAIDKLKLMFRALALLC